MRYYVLDGKTPRPVSDVIEWGLWFEDVSKRVVQQTAVGRILISTVFLGLDHRFGGRPGDLPILFETMVFGIPVLDDYQERCCSWDEALEQHRFAGALVAGVLKSIHQRWINAIACSALVFLILWWALS